MSIVEGSEELVARTRRALLAEILDQVSDVAAPAEIRDLAQALAFLAPLSPSGPPGSTAQTGPTVGQQCEEER